MLAEIINQYHSPLYIYSESTIIANINRLKQSISYSRVMFCYAMKANSNTSILKTIRDQQIGIDCVSQGEILTALKVGFDPSKIRFTPTFASQSEIVFAISQGIQISIDSMPMVEWIMTEFPGLAIGLRMNPSVMAGAYLKTSTGHAKAKFGIGMNQVPSIIKLIKNDGLLINGLHIHSGSDILEIDQFMDAVEVLLEVAPLFNHLEYLDLGSGFKVAYFPGDKETDMDEFGKIISDRIIQFCQVYGKELKIIFEPGKFVVSNAGQFVVTCTGVKDNGGINFAGVDSGFNHLIRPMFYGAFHTIKNLSNPKGELKTYDIVGNICETDTFASDRLVPEIRLGDLLVFENAGAYCYSMSSPYNTRPRPAEVYIRTNGKAELIRRRETLDDILASQTNL